MAKRLQAVDKDRARPALHTVPLEETNQDVSRSDPAIVSQDLAGYFTPEEWAEAAHDDISLDEVRRGLSTISGSLSKVVIALPQER